MFYKDVEDEINGLYCPFYGQTCTLTDNVYGEDYFPDRMMTNSPFTGCSR
jgi:hypothetical protein